MAQHSNRRAILFASLAATYFAALIPFPVHAGDDLNIDIVVQSPQYESRRHAARERRVERERHKDGKSEYKYDDGVVKIEEKIDRRAGKYEYKYEGPEGNCEEKYDQGKYEYKCD